MRQADAPQSCMNAVSSASKMACLGAGCVPACRKPVGCQCQTKGCPACRLQAAHTFKQGGAPCMHDCGHTGGSMQPGQSDRQVSRRLVSRAGCVQQHRRRCCQRHKEHWPRHACLHTSSSAPGCEDSARLELIPPHMPALRSSCCSPAQGCMAGHLCSAASKPEVVLRENPAPGSLDGSKQRTAS